MGIRPLIAGILGGLVVTTAQASVLPFTIQEQKLDNGLRVVMVPYDSPGLIAYYSLVRVGSRDEVEKGVTGFAHFFEHMMFRGTEKHPPPVVQALLKQAGADQNGFTTDDFTCYTFFGSSQYLAELVAYEADRFQNLRYSEADFKTEAGAVLGEYNKSSSGTYLPLQEKLRSLVYRRHTYGHTTLGYLADIKDMPNQYQYSLKFFERFYTPDNTLLVVVGDFQPEQLMGLVKQHYAGWRRKRAVTATQKEPPQTREVRAQVPFKGATLPKLSVSWRTPASAPGSAETAVYGVLYELLFGQTSALYRELVLEQGSVESFADWSWPHRDPYQFQVVATIKDPARQAEIEQKIHGAVQALAQGKLEPQFLADVKAHVRYELLLGLDTPSAIANTLVYALAPTGQVDALERWLVAIDKLTAKDIQNFAKKYLTASNRAVVTLASESTP